MKRSASSVPARRRGASAASTKKGRRATATRAVEQYDFRGGARGKYGDRYAAETNVVVLEADVARAFPTARAVNDALRELLSQRHP